MKFEAKGDVSVLFRRRFVVVRTEKESLGRQKQAFLPDFSEGGPRFIRNQSIIRQILGN
jgi:hypothetical protein